MDSPFWRPNGGTRLGLIGIEADSLLGFIALLGLLRALEAVRSAWRPRISWEGPPWVPCLHLAEQVDAMAVALAASEGIDALVPRLDVDGRATVDFDRAAYRTYARRVRGDMISSALAAAIAAEWPADTRSGKLRPAPLVLMSGQGHQEFLARLVAIPRSDAPGTRDPTKIAEALFEPWRRNDRTAAFRWDPEEDQRHALRFGDPSKAGAARTVHGANRLAAIGFLSFATVSGQRQIAAIGAVRAGNGWSFVWPIWSAPMSLSGVEALLVHPDVHRFAHSALRPLGVLELYRAHRISNGKFMNVTRAWPSSDPSPQEASDDLRG